MRSPAARSSQTSSASSGSVAQGEAETKWCSCCTSPGATRAAIGSTLLRSPGSSKPSRWSGAQRRCSRRASAARKGASHRSSSPVQPPGRDRSAAPAPHGQVQPTPVQKQRGRVVLLRTCDTQRHAGRYLRRRLATRGAPRRSRRPAMTRPSNTLVSPEQNNYIRISNATPPPAGRREVRKGKMVRK
ncbi:MAG: hypothetical protein AVDCRST_MAG08-4166 [uncultured Acetobacteraceae bacterium]|uniref:Uncharacterized protein n=1 Tax=uncultured Acetobacteraceae bacterium TaxID=169975 RepID=A0A6J4JRD2_9PROT|nr:MAG: hypothetical protein AVDCRST_MAG08-4166 [uncultured Acetobacteraceae bacterium]